MPRDVRLAVLAARRPQELELAFNARMQAEELEGRELVRVQALAWAGDLLLFVVTGRSDGGCARWPAGTPVVVR
jgi:hypothetical protein